jgi:hypothetical protein
MRSPLATTLASLLCAALLTVGAMATLHAEDDDQTTTTPTCDPVSDFPNDVACRALEGANDLNQHTPEGVRERVQQVIDQANKEADCDRIRACRNR